LIVDWLIANKNEVDNL